MLGLRPARALSLLISILAATSLLADSSIKGSQIEEVVRKVSARQKSIDTLRANFRQEKVLALLSEPEVSTGTFSFARPNRVLWSYDSPKPVTMLIADGLMTTYYPEIRRAEEVEVRRFEDQIFRYMGAVSGAMEDLGRYFNFRFIDSAADPHYVLEMTPKSRTVERRVRKITVWIDRETYVTSKFEYIEGDGDLTRYEFLEIEINPEIPDADFSLELPDDVRIERVELNQ